MDNENSGKSSLQSLIFIVLALVCLAMFVSRQMESVGDFINQSGWVGLVFSVILYALLGASPIPSEPFTILITSIFGPLAAAGVATFGNSLAALVEFYIGGKLGDVTDFERRKAQLPFGLANLPVDSPAFLILARMLPGFGPKCVSLVSGVYGVPLWRYLWTTFVSSLLGGLVVAFGGFGLLSLLPWK
ncbi:MAG: VTT domain-containing protein [Anaerolineae bacterium]|nr:VTT domain-containing protein [Anaerolineae bacterium]